MEAETPPAPLFPSLALVQLPFPPSCIDLPPRTCELFLRQVLTLVYERGEEIPLVALYRKELASELLSMREEDSPAVRKPVFHPSGCVCTLLHILLDSFIRTHALV